MPRYRPSDRSMFDNRIAKLVRAHALLSSAVNLLLDARAECRFEDGVQRECLSLAREAERLADTIDKML